jgi:hypothetical protein
MKQPEKGLPYIYGDEVPWEEFGGFEYLHRLEDLIAAHFQAFGLAHGNPDNPRVSEAEKEYPLRFRQLEETALEFVAHQARLRIEREWDGS